MAAGRHGIGVLSIGAGIPGGPEMLSKQWGIAEDEAAKHGKTMSRNDWRVVVNMHCAEDDEEALRQVKVGERLETVTYFEETLGRPPGRSDDPLRDGVKMGTTLIGSPDTIAKGIEYLLELSKGGFGAITFRANEWAKREDIFRSYELFARYVAPRFQGQLETIRASNAWVKANRSTVLAGNVEAVKKAFTDTGREVPVEFASRTLGAQDLKEGKTS